jgi:hypothetical protein
MPRAEYVNSACVLGGMMYIVGAGNAGHALLRFDPAVDAWSTLASSLDSYWRGASFVLGSCLYAAEGSTVERYDAATDTWTTVADLREGRRCDFRAVTIGHVGLADEPDFFESLIIKAIRRDD